MKKKWIIKQIDNDKVLHFLLKKKIFDHRADCTFLPLDENIYSIQKKDADILLVNFGLADNELSLGQISKPAPNQAIIALVNSKKQLNQLSAEIKLPYIEKGIDSIAKITDIIESTIFNLYERERNMTISF
ncbi:hypothetical protein GYB57_08005 [bacterium]|nr:hypothetical protein [bacterium]